MKKEMPCLDSVSVITRWRWGRGEESSTLLAEVARKFLPCNLGNLINTSEVSSLGKLVRSQSSIARLC